MGTVQERLPISLPMEAIAAFCQRWNIIELALFGSVLRDDFGPDSDIDVLVTFAPGAVVGLNFITMQRELSELLGHPVDLNTYESLSRHFRDRVRATAQRIYERAG
jgi:hypothetical protein